MLITTNTAPKVAMAPLAIYFHNVRLFSPLPAIRSCLFEALTRFHEAVHIRIISTYRTVAQQKSETTLCTALIILLAISKFTTQKLGFVGGMTTIRRR